MTKYEEKLEKQIEELQSLLGEKDELYDNHVEILKEMLKCGHRIKQRLDASESIIESLLTICNKDEDVIKMLVDLYENITVGLAETDTIIIDAEEEVGE